MRWAWLVGGAALIAVLTAYQHFNGGHAGESGQHAASGGAPGAAAKYSVGAE